MTEVLGGAHYFVGELPDGRFVAASNLSPYFCFRAETEDAVIAKAEAGLAFYFDYIRETRKPLRRSTSTLTSWQNQRAVRFKGYAPAA